MLSPSYEDCSRCASRDETTPALIGVDEGQHLQPDYPPLPVSDGVPTPNDPNRMATELDATRSQQILVAGAP
jgi:hypothetical protein